MKRANACRAGSRAASLGLVFVLIAWALALMAPPACAADPAQGPGGPILVVTSGPSIHGTYYAEILRTEGFNAFQVADIGAVTPTMLAGYDVVLLAKMPLTAPQVSMLENWVTGGGNLIAMAPDVQLAGLLGLTAGGTPLAEGYLLVDTTSAPGNGIVGQTMQFHGSANLWTLSGATSIATLYSSASTATGSPAVSLRKNVGSGNAAAFAYDLATSIVYTRHGNPAWAEQERDGFAPIRSDDKFYGAKTGDVQNDWVDLNKVSIPQADEQQRLLANLIVAMNDSRKPLPRFWYFPNGKKAVVIMTGDDHGNGGTAGRFDQFKALGPGNCSVANWECVRGTSYVYASTPLTDAQVAQYTSDGFEVGLHINTSCNDFTLASLQATYGEQVPVWQSAYPSAGPPVTQRHHCIVWSDWSSGAQVQLSNGMRLDTSYYFWPPSWVADVPGMFTGSAMPMRFTKPDGSFVDVYMAATQMTDESGQTYPKTIDTLLDRAVGAEGYYGAYTVNAHTDNAQSDVADAVVTSARARGVPLVSAKQMLTWLDGRNASSFGAIAFNGATLSFTVTKDASANGLQAMLPLRSGSALLLGLTRGGATVSYSVNTVKGVDYAFFAAESGSYAATYGVDSAAPVVVSQTPAPGSSGVAVGAAVIASFNEALMASSVTGSTFFLQNAAPPNALVSASISYDSASRTATLRPAAALAASTTYTATLRGGTTDPRIKDAAGNALTANVVWSFTTGAAPPPPSCPCSAWSASTTPTTPPQSDPNAVELGVKFTTSINGFITGVRFYKGTGNTGTHVGNLWSAGGALLARATFSAETASGWQQVNFASPVPVNANTVYVASYYAPNGRYAADPNFFATSGVSNGPVNLLSNGTPGGNGVYNYSSTTTFPSLTFNATNYWVDLVFSATGTTPPDTTPPTVSSVSPAAGATGVATTTAVSATFSEAMNAATIGTSTFELRDAASVPVASNVSYDAPTLTARLTPTVVLAAAQTYTATVSTGVKDAAGNALAAPRTWSFTTGAAPPPPSCPCSAWSASTTPTTPADSDPSAVELGVKFRVDVDGFVTGIRFYKGTGNTGTHIGSLWSSGGTRLNAPTATFTGESASGWQQVNFATPVAITAGTVYVASYHAPNGHYAGDNGYFASTGVDNGPVHLLPSGGANGGNGVYSYGSTSGFPTQTYNATNYWVDIVFSITGTPDTTPPAVSSVSPAAGATGVATTTAVSATFSEAMNAATIGASTFELRDAANVLVASNVSYDAPTLTARLTPTAVLAAAQTYTARVLGGSTGVKDAAGNALTANFVWSFTTGSGTGGCSAPPNPIVAENCLAGSPASEWDISGSGDPSIQGFATDISVNRGTTVSFKVDTNATAYRFDIYRMGYYDGLGARKVASVNPSAALPQNQPNCLNNASTGLIDCGNWAVSGSWPVPATAVSGIYFAKLVRADNGGASHIVFIVRDDASQAPLLFQTSDTTWQAYNNYGGNSLYTGSPDGRAYKVSYNRPFNTRAVDNGQDWLFNAEYPMVRWLESNGYDVAYISGVDSHRADPLLLRNHKVFLSVGHDEYWSGGQRANVTAARDAGVHLAFFSGNEVFWKTRWEPSIDGSNTAYRTLVCYKETHANAKIDPSSEWTGTWRDPRFSPPSDGGRPENGLAGTIFMANDTGVPFSIEVPAADGKMRFWRNTGVASLAAGQTATLPVGTLGYEWDSELDNGARPPGLWRLSTTPKTNFSGALLDYGSNYGNGNVTHYLTQYRAPSGALVFGAGTIQWSWGLDASHDRGSAAADLRMQQATVNLFADMGVQPATLRQGLVAASASTDATPPTSTIASPTAGSTLAVGTPVTISGSASDGGGVVGGVEISVDGGTSWHPAVGRSSWSYVWTPPSSGTFTIRTRAVDDSGNLQAPGAGITVTAGTVPDTTAPTVSAVTPANNATGVARTVSPTVTFSEAIDPSTINSTTFELRNASTNALVFAVVSYAAATRRATLNPSGNLAAGTRFTATVRGGATDPRVKDLAGNPLAGQQPFTWSFTTR